MKSSQPILGLVAMLLLLAAPPLVAQKLDGELVEEGTNQPISGAIVVLIGENGAHRASTLTNDSGRFSLQIPAPAHYRLKAERIGFAATSTPLLDLRTAAGTRYRMVIRSMAISLAGVEVTGRRRCEIRPREGLEIHRLWEEARKALTATTLTQADRRLRVRIAQYERDMDLAGARLGRERTSSRSGVTDNPFTTLPAEELARDGYIRAEPGSPDTLYYAPDAGVLLSDSFLDTHCFRYVPAGRADAGLVGLGFEPVRARNVPDIRGTLWLDEATAELRFVEYSYTGIRLDGPADRIGGRLEFERVPSGAWIVRRWWIRVPLRAREILTLPDGRVRERLVVAGIREVGGEATDVAHSGGGRTTVSSGRLEGIVYDPTVEAPVGGATVYLSGTHHSAETSAEGRFALEDIAPGEYQISFLHPVLDTIGIFPTPLGVVALADSTTQVELSVPDSFGGLGGRLTDAIGMPLAGAELVLVGRGRSARTDPQGRFRMVGLSPGTYSLEVRHPEYPRERFEAVVEEGRARRLALALDIRPVAIEGVQVAVAARDAGFRERMRMGTGHFITREQLERQNPPRFTDLLSGVPGVRLVNSASGERVEMTTSRPDVYSQSVRGPVDPVRDAQRRGELPADSQPTRGTPVGVLQRLETSMGSDARLGNCPVLYFLDGSPFQPMSESGLFYELPLAMIEAIEVYARAASVPAQFRLPGYECGAILIWTRRSPAATGSRGG